MQLHDLIILATGIMLGSGTVSAVWLFFFKKDLSRTIVVHSKEEKPEETGRVIWLSGDKEDATIERAANANA